MARPDWWMFTEVARRMGFARAFDYPNPAAIFREHAALSAFENNGTRVFNIGALAGCDDAAYDALQPVQWPCPRHGTSAQRLFARGGFPTPDSRARMVPVTGRMADRGAGDALRLNTGRVRDQWHTMTRTGWVPHLMAHSGEPFLAMHPRDAAARGLADGGLARIDSDAGAAVRKVQGTADQSPGDVFAPMHWTDQFSSSGPVDRLVHAKTDPVSGQPDLKGASVRVTVVDTQWTGLLARRAGTRPDLGESVYWSKAPAASGFAFDLAGWTKLADVIHSETILRRLLQVPAEAELCSYSDPRKSVFRYAGFVGGMLEACLFLAPMGVVLPARGPALELLGRSVTPRDRPALLAAQTPAKASTEKIVCSCFSVGNETIACAIRERGLTSVAQIGAALRAGTNCGSCVPELKKLLAAAPALSAAE